MSISKKVLNMRAKELGNGSPKEVLCKANEDLSPDFNKYAFVTALYGILEFSTGRFTFCRAGHEAPILFKSGMQGQAFDTKGMPLGTDIGKRFHFFLEEKTIHIAPDDYLLLCTDGLAESRNEREGIFSRARLLFSVGQVKPSMTCREALHRILQTVEEFSGGRSQEDDITAILLHRIAPGR
jgi:sigma-B regulation protein RsbU (phosphoserine phosphatase)